MEIKEKASDLLVELIHKSGPTTVPELALGRALTNYLLAIKELSFPGPGTIIERGTLSERKK